MEPGPERTTARLSYQCGFRHNCTVAQGLPNPKASRMNRVRSLRLFLCCVLGGLAIAIAAILWTSGSSRARDVIDIFPGGDIQAALEAVARRPGKGTIRVHAGTYRPATAGQAFLFLNARHDGVTLEAVGDVVLSAGNPEIADPAAPSYPAVVNHVVYFGDGISRATTFRGFKVTGANGFVSGPSELMTVHTADDLEKSAAYRTLAPSPIESNSQLKKTHYFYADGGGMLIYGRSYPTIEAVEFQGNFGSVCRRRLGSAPRGGVAGFGPLQRLYLSGTTGPRSLEAGSISWSREAGRSSRIACSSAISATTELTPTAARATPP